MIKLKYTKGKNYDDLLEELMKQTKIDIVKRNNDTLFYIIGATGSGKSNLALHMMTMYLEGEASTDYISLDRSSFAYSLKKVCQKPLPRFIIYDEANINKRDSASKFNKEAIDIYMSIRSKNVCHIWCSPSLDMMDKYFIRERIKGFFLVDGTGTNIRAYYYFRKDTILQILTKYNSLNLPLLHRLKHRYAYYMGCFKPYTGHLLKAYEKKKDSRIDDKLNHFIQTFAKDEQISSTVLRNKLGITRQTFNLYCKELLKRGKIEEEKDYWRVGHNKILFIKEVIPYFFDLMKERNQNSNTLAQNLAKRQESISSNMGDHEINEQKQSN
jgi:ABC-type dipeptide/oligopeptide/nickel transport system ATPase component